MVASVTKLFSPVGAAIGCRFLKQKNQLVFVEWDTGGIGGLDWIRQKVWSGWNTTLIKEGMTLDCDSGNLSPLAGPGDILWQKIGTNKWQMVPVGGASIVNLGTMSSVDFRNNNLITPAYLQAIAYDKSPIPGDQLVKDDVFAVWTGIGNVAKIQVLNYGKDIEIAWEIYRLASPYKSLGTGYTNPEDIAVCADEKTAYVTERTGNLLKVDLGNAKRSAAKVIASGMEAPHQIHLDEVHQQAYVVEYTEPGKPPGHLFRIDLKTGAKTTLLSGLKEAVGLLISSDLAYAYISEQSAAGGYLNRYSLQNGTRMVVASGLKSVFFLTWADQAQTRIFVPERDPDNRITVVETTGNSQQVVKNTGVRPSCVAFVDPAHLLVCCNQEIDVANLLEGTKPMAIGATGLFMGIGHVPFYLFSKAAGHEGQAETTKDPAYPYQFTKYAPFGGWLSLQIDHMRAYQQNARYYRVFIDGNKNPRLDTWHDLQLNPANGQYEIDVTFQPKTIGLPLATKEGCYDIHAPVVSYCNKDLGMYLNSSTLRNGQQSFQIDFLDDKGNLLYSETHSVWIDNQRCTASIEMPSVDGVSATTDCGMLEYHDKTKEVKIDYVASHPLLFATYDWCLGRAGKGPVNNTTCYKPGGNVQLPPFQFKERIDNLLGTCTIAAFYAYVYVYARAIDGFSRQSQYDASSIIAFALAP
jgi:hypothetical protein